MIDATHLDALVQAIAQAIGSQLASSSSVSGAGQGTALNQHQPSAPASSRPLAETVSTVPGTAIRRLGEGGVVGVLPATPSSPAPSSPAPSSPAPSSPVADTTGSGTGSPELAAWKLDQRLITQATLQGRLAGIRQLIVPSKAVVTPTALDLLRKQGIELQRDSNTDALLGGAAASLPTAVGRSGKKTLEGSASARLGTLYVHGDDPAVPQRNWQSIWPRDRWLVESLVACPLPQAIAELAAVLSSSGRLGILLSSEPDAAVWLANRQTTLRATMAGTVDAVRTAVQSIGANLLIIAPQRTPAYSSRAIVRQFLADGPRICPQRWASVDKQTVGAAPRAGV
jgi:hypothetical protein